VRGMKRFGGFCNRLAIRDLRKIPIDAS
jgi:hypothetical protein